MQLHHNIIMKLYIIAMCNIRINFIVLQRNILYSQKILRDFGVFCLTTKIYSWIFAKSRTNQGSLLSQFNYQLQHIQGHNYSCICAIARVEYPYSQVLVVTAGVRYIAVWYIVIDTYSQLVLYSEHFNGDVLVHNLKN